MYTWSIAIRAVFRSCNANCSARAHTHDCATTRAQQSPTVLDRSSAGPPNKTGHVRRQAAPSREEGERGVDGNDIPRHSAGPCDGTADTQPLPDHSVPTLWVEGCALAVAVVLSPAWFGRPRGQKHCHVSLLGSRKYTHARAHAHTRARRIIEQLLAVGGWRLAVGSPYGLSLTSKKELLGPHCTPADGCLRSAGCGHGSLR